MRYRADINGLRAVAVASVLLFHFGIPLFSGGFAGVDVFFVISGFLMTQILVSRFANNDDGSTVFAVIGDFYLARARRIIPVLATLCAAVLLLGYFIFDPIAYRDATGNGLSSLLFYSNLKYYLGAGYFAPASTTNPFLHTWSLSVEWQFYLLYPILIWGLVRLAKVRLEICLAMLALAGFALCLFLTWMQPAFGFYTLPARAWEMFAGGAVYALPRQTGSRLSMLAGATLIALSIFAFDQWTTWPSWAAGVPVLGTCLVIFAERCDSRWCDNPIIRYVGKSSYSIYVWHWPVIVLGHYFELPTSAFSVASQMVATLALASFSYEFIERRTMSRLLRSSAMSIVIPVAATLMIAAGLGIVASANGLPERQPQHAVAFADYRRAGADWGYPKNCGGFRTPIHAETVRLCQAGAGRADTLITGDSFAQQLYVRYKYGTTGVTFAATGGCPPIPLIDQRRWGQRCDRYVDAVDNLIARSGFRRIVLTATWPAYFEEPLAFRDYGFCERIRSRCLAPTNAAELRTLADRSLARIDRRVLLWRKQGLEVMIMLSTPYASVDLPMTRAKYLFHNWNASRFSAISRAEYQRHAPGFEAGLRAIAIRRGALIYDPLTTLCSKSECPITDSSGALIYRDNDHIRASFIRRTNLAPLDRFIGTDPNRIGEHGPE